MAPRYKSATPALNDKLQHYREDPEARAELNRRARQAHAEKAAAAQGPVSPKPFRPQSAIAAGTPAEQQPSTAADALAAVAVPAAAKSLTFRRNFIEENAAVISPWPCTGPLSSKALDAAQQQPTLWLREEAESPKNSSSLVAPSGAAMRPGSAAAVAQRGSVKAAASSNELAGRPNVMRSLTLDLTAIQTRNAKYNTQQKSTESSPSPARTPALAQGYGSNSNSQASSVCSHRSLTAGAAWSPADCAGNSSCLELLAAQMAAKKEVAATRAAEAAERRTAIAAAEQQRRQARATRVQSREAEQLAAQQAEQEQALLQERHQLWGSVVAAAALTAVLVGQLHQMKSRGAAATVIAACYKRHLIMKRARKLAELVVQLKRLLKPYMERQQRAAHARCAARVLSFLQLTQGNTMILTAVQRLRHSVVYIQRYWRRVRMIRAAQEALLIRAMKKLEQHVAQRNRAAATTAGAQTCSRSGSRAASCVGQQAVCSGSGSSSGSGRKQDNSWDLQSAASGSRSREDRSYSSPIAGGLRLGAPLVRPHEFFLGQPGPTLPAVDGASSSGSMPGGGALISPEAAATPHGPMPPRGVQITGELTVRRPASPSTVAQLHMPDGSNRASSIINSSRQQSRGLQASSNSSPSSGSPTRLHCSHQSLKGPQTGASSGSAGPTVGFHDDHVIDLELEARLKDLLDPLATSIRKEVVRGHLTNVRRQLVAACEQHAAAMSRYREKLKLEELKVQLLKQAGVDVSITLEAPVVPRMRVLVPKSKLKALIAEGMDLQVKQHIEARLRADDASGAALAAACHSSASGRSTTVDKFTL